MADSYNQNFGTIFFFFIPFSFYYYSSLHNTHTLTNNLLVHRWIKSLSSCGIKNIPETLNYFELVAHSSGARSVIQRLLLRSVAELFCLFSLNFCVRSVTHELAHLLLLLLHAHHPAHHLDTGSRADLNYGYVTGCWNAGTANSK